VKQGARIAKLVQLCCLRRDFAIHAFIIGSPWSAQGTDSCIWVTRLAQTRDQLASNTLIGPCLDYYPVSESESLRKAIRDRVATEIRQAMGLIHYSVVPAIDLSGSDTSVA